MARLGVFNTRFSPEAAIAVAAGGAVTPESILDGLANLSAKSLIVSSLAGGRFVPFFGG